MTIGEEFISPKHAKWITYGTLAFLLLIISGLTSTWTFLGLNTIKFSSPLNYILGGLIGVIIYWIRENYV